MTASSNNRSFWSLAKCISRNFSEPSFPPILGQDGTLHSNPTEKANIFVKTFALNSTLDDSSKIPPFSPPIHPSMKPIQFTPTSVQKALSSLQANKASGPDKIPPIVLKNCSHQMAPILSHLYNVSYCSAHFPTSWKHTHIFPIPKKGDRSNPNNYRPIALIPIFSKVMESIITQQLLSFLESKNIVRLRT